MPEAEKRRCHCGPGCTSVLSQRQRHRHYRLAELRGEGHLIAPSVSTLDSDDDMQSGSSSGNDVAEGDVTDSDEADANEANASARSHRLEDDSMSDANLSASADLEDEPADLTREALWRQTIDQLQSLSPESLFEAEDEWEELLFGLQKAETERTAEVDNTRTF